MSEEAKRSTPLGGIDHAPDKLTPTYPPCETVKPTCTGS